jgi:rhodanese-related sulfurtransferase
MQNQKTIKGIIILAGISLALALVVNYFSPEGIPLVGQWDTAKGVITANPTGLYESKPQEIDSVTLAKELFDSGDVLFVDARSSDNYEDGHISGAISLPVGEFDERIESFLNRYSTDQPIVTYCSGRTCEDSHNLARLLSDAGYTRVRIFIDGFPGWEVGGYPVE